MGKISSSSVWSCAFSGILSSRHRVILSIQRRWHIDAILLILLSIIDEGVSEKTKYSALAVFLPILKYGDCLYFAATVNAYSACHFCCFCKHLDSWQSHLSLDPLTLGSARSQGILKSLEFFAELHAYEHMCILRGHRAKWSVFKKSQKLLLKVSWTRKELKWLHEMKKWHNTDTGRSLSTYLLLQL